MKNYLIIVKLILIPYIFLSQGLITPELSKIINNNPPNKLIPIIIEVNDDFDLESLSLYFKENNTPIKKRASIICEQMTTIAQESQEYIINEIKSKPTEYSHLKSSWIVNCIFLNASNLLIKNLAFHPNIKRIQIKDYYGDVSGRIENSDSTNNSLRIDVDPDDSGASSVFLVRIDGNELVRLNHNGKFGIGMNDPATPPNAAPIVLKIACPAGSPDSKDTIPITSGPTIGILPKNLERNGLAPLNAGEITPAALPNIFAANPPTFAIPLLANPFAPVINFDPTLPNCGNNLVTKFAPLLIKPLTSLKAFFSLVIMAVNIFFPMIFHTKNAFNRGFIFSMKVVNFLAPSSPKILPTILSAPSTSLYPKSMKPARPSRRPPAKLKRPSIKGTAFLNKLSTPISLGANSINFIITMPYKNLVIKPKIPSNNPTPGTLNCGMPLPFSFFLGFSVAVSFAARLSLSAAILFFLFAFSFNTRPSCIV